MNQSIVNMQQKEAANYAWKRVNGGEYPENTSTVFRIFHDDTVVDSWVSGKVSMNIIRPNLGAKS